MAKEASGGGRRLTRLKSALKRLPSLSKLVRTTSNVDRLIKAPPVSVLHPVYVGSHRRLYWVSPEVIEHPLFQELLHRSGEEETKVDCEVVLFEHLLWMIENSDGDEEQHFGELVDFYTCCEG